MRSKVLDIIFDESVHIEDKPILFEIKLHLVLDDWITFLTSNY